MARTKNYRMLETGDTSVLLPSHPFTLGLRRQGPERLNDLSLVPKILCLWPTSSKKPSFIKWTLPYLSTQSLTPFFIVLLNCIKCIDLKMSFTFKHKFCIPEGKKQRFYLHGYYIWCLSCCSFFFFCCHEQFKIHKSMDTKGGKRQGVGLVVWWIGRLGLTCIHWCV